MAALDEDTEDMFEALELWSKNQGLDCSLVSIFATKKKNIKNITQKTKRCHLEKLTLRQMSTRKGTLIKMQ